MPIAYWVYEEYISSQPLRLPRNKYRKNDMNGRDAIKERGTSNKLLHYFTRCVISGKVYYLPVFPTS